MARAIDIRPSERRSTALAFLTLMGILAGHSLLETARDALFLARLPASRLPWAYLAIAALIVVMAKLNQHCIVRVRKDILFSASLIIAGVVTAAFWTLFHFGVGTAPYIFYIWSGLVASVVVVQFWLLLSDAFDVSQAKRLYAFIGVGGLMGATVGSGLAGALLTTIGPETLLLVGAGIFMSLAVTPRLILPEAANPQPAKEAKAAPTREMRKANMRNLKDEPYLRRLLILVLVSTVALTLLDLLFKHVVSQHVAAEELGGFFAKFYTSVNAIGLVVQLVAAPWLLRRFGVNRVVLVLPLLLVASAASFWILAGLLPFLLMRGTDGVLRHSVSRTSTELLYMPLSGEVRDRFKTFIDGVGQRGGQAVGSLLFLAASTAALEPAHLVVFLTALLIVWLVAASGLKKHYVRLFRAQLKEGVVATRGNLNELELSSLETLLSSLNSADDNEVVAALDLFERYERVNLVPALLLYHPSKEVVLRAIDLFAEAERSDVLAVARRRLQDPDPEIQAAVIRLTAQGSPDEAMLREFLQSPHPQVQVTALACLIAAGFLDSEEAKAPLRSIIDGDDLRRKLALARAARFHDAPIFGWALAELSEVKDVELLTETITSMRQQPRAEFLPHLVRLLAYRQVRRFARRALHIQGDRALDYLGEALEDFSLSRAIRRHLPRTISPFMNARAANMLLTHLPQEPDGNVRFKILRGLGGMLSRDPTIAIDRKLVQSRIRTAILQAVQMLEWRLALKEALDRNPDMNTPSGELMTKVLAEKERNALNRLFRLFKLLRPGEDFELIHASLSSSDPRRRASSRELVEYLVQPSLKQVVVSMVSDGRDQDRLAGSREVLESESSPLTPAVRDAPPSLKPLFACLGRLLTAESSLIRDVARHWALEIKMEERDLVTEAPAQLESISAQGHQLALRLATEAST